jgi:hypothetical protein
MKKVKYAVTDWATNYLQTDGTFNRSFYGRNPGAPKLFSTAGEAHAWLDTMFPNEIDRGEFFVYPFRGVP